MIPAMISLKAKDLDADPNNANARSGVDLVKPSYKIIKDLRR
jgi:hypothetical protein